MTAVAQPKPGLIATLRQRWNDAAIERGIARARHAADKKFFLIATGRTIVVQESLLLGHSSTFKATIYFFENALCERKIKTTCSACWEAPQVAAFLEGMDLAEVIKMRGHVDLEKAA